MVIHVVIALAAGYAVGSEFRRRSMRAWLACAGGNPIVALAGKLAPLFAIFFLIMLSVPLILEGLFEIPFKGNVPMIVAAASLLIIGYLALGALLQLLVRDLPTGLGLTGLIVSPAFGYVGVGFPILGMNAFSQAWSAILPLRWYMAVLLGQAARGLPVPDSAAPFAALAALAVLYALLALLRLRSIAAGIGRERRGRNRRRPLPRRAASAAPLPPNGGACSRMRGAFILLVVAPLVYGMYYPQPYLGPDPAQDPDRGRRQRPERSEPRASCRRWTRAARSAWRCAPTRSPRRMPRSTAARPSRWSASRPAPSATCSRA